MHRSKIVTIGTCCALAAGASVGCSEDGTIEADSITCEVGGSPRPIGEAKLYFEYNSTDEDTGIHGLFDSSGWSELCVTDPDGNRFLAVKPQGSLREHHLGGIFFESREPPAGEVSHEAVLARFPAGEYRVVGRAVSGEMLAGAATLTHDIPAPPVILAPAPDEVVDPANVIVRWSPVTQTVAGDAVTITGYEVIVTNEDLDGADPNGMSQPIASIHVIPSVTSLSMPREFFEPATRYELELIAIEQSGNQTITVQFFDIP